MNDTPFAKWLWLNNERQDTRLIAQLRLLAADREHFVPELWQQIDEHDLDRDAAITVAAMFAFKPSSSLKNAEHDFGWTAKTLRAKLSATGDPHGISKRLRNILDASDHESLAFDLMWFARMCKEHDVGIHWAAMYNDLALFFADLPTFERPQTRWARSFWGTGSKSVAT